MNIHHETFVSFYLEMKKGIFKIKCRLETSNEFLINSLDQWFYAIRRLRISMISFMRRSEQRLVNF